MLFQCEAIVDPSSGAVLGFHRSARSSTHKSVVVAKCAVACHARTPFMGCVLPLRRFWCYWMPTLHIEDGL